MDGTPIKTIETKNRSHRETKKEKSLVPLAIIILGAAVLLFIAFYIFLLIFNGYKFSTAKGADGSTCTVTKIERRAIAPFIYFPSNLEIPESIDGAAVTAIGYKAASGLADIKTVAMPKSVTSVGEEAFAECLNMESITAEGVVSIGIGAFRGCILLENVALGEALTNIGKSAFEGCSKLSSLDISDNVKAIGERAFYSCTSLAGISCGGKIETVGEEAFWGCESLASVEFKKGIGSIAKYAFWGCSALESAKLGAVKEIGANAFSGCTSLKSLALTDGTEIIGDRAFTGCTSLASFELPGSILGIGESAFEKCSSLKEISYGGSADEWGLTTLGKYWLYGSSLSSVSCEDGKVALE